MYLTLFVLVLINTTLAIQNCCPNDNIIINRTCSDGSLLNSLSCTSKYLTKKEKDTYVDENEYLIITEARIPPHRYCTSTLDKDQVFLVCFDESSSASDTIFTVYAILELISVFFILMTIFVYLQIRDVLDLQSTCILHSISGLAISFIALATNQLLYSRVEMKLCKLIAYVIYVTMLYSFFWLNVLAFHIWRTIVRPNFCKINKYWVKIYHLYGTGGPFILLVILLIAHSIERSDIHPGFGETKCWFKSTKTQFIYFYSPIAVLLFLNLIFYAWTVIILWRHLTNIDEKKTKVLKYRLLLCVKLFVIMGISWIFELISAATQGNPNAQHIWYVTDGFNTLQGILIFLILVVFRKRVVRNLAERSICGVRLPSRWRAAADDECEDIEEELNLSETQIPKI